MQFRAEDYDGEEDQKMMSFMNDRQFVAWLKARSDAERGDNRYLGVNKRANGRWQSRVTGKVVRINIAPALVRIPAARASQDARFQASRAVLSRCYFTIATCPERFAAHQAARHLILCQKLFLMRS